MGITNELISLRRQSAIRNAQPGMNIASECHPPPCGLNRHEIRNQIATPMENCNHHPISMEGRRSYAMSKLVPNWCANQRVPERQLANEIISHVNGKSRVESSRVQNANGIRNEQSFTAGYRISFPSPNVKRMRMRMQLRAHIDSRAAMNRLDVPLT